MKILVTGGAGFIGSHIVDAYIKDGHDVVVVDNFSTGKRENVNPRARVYAIDICGPNVSEVFAKEKPDVLSHHAAQIDVRTSVEDPQNDLRTNLGGLINLVEAGRRNGLKKVVLASSGGALYGEQEFFPATEEHPTRPISPYGLNKLSSEQYLYFYEKAYGIEWTALRYSNVYGPRQNSQGEAGVVALFASKMLAGNQPVINGDGTQTRDYVYVGDVVEANSIALKESVAGAYNVGTGVETSVNTIFKALRELIGSGCAEKHGPAKAGEQQRSCISAAKIEKLGWKSKMPFAEGLRVTAEWFKETLIAHNSQPGVNQ